MEQATDKWTAKKQEHLRLSAAAAEQYDEIYESANFATGSYMRYELEQIEKYVAEAPVPRALAIDLGCGTGRDSFVLARHFGQVYAYDFSPEMIQKANRNKLKNRVGNVLFEVADVEEGMLPLTDNSVSFVNTAFGMGSFIRRPEKLFREVRRVLQPGGVAVFSFYNANALVNTLDLEWQPALAARVVSEEDTLEVDFSGRVYKIAARAYQFQEIKNRLKDNFRIREITTYPTLSALFPQTLFANETARRLCTVVDHVLAASPDIAAGPYIIGVCQKRGRSQQPGPSLGYERVLELLRCHGITPDLKEHGPVRTMADVEKVVKVSPSLMVKSILIAVEEKKCLNEKQAEAELYLAGVPADRKIDMRRLAEVLARKRKHIRLATPKEVQNLTGFMVGGIPPFGLPKNIPVIIDAPLFAHPVVWCGTGKATESLRLRIEDLKRLSACTVADISRQT